MLDHQLTVEAHHRRHLVVVDAAVPALVAAVIVVGQVVHAGASSGVGPIALGVASAAVLLGRRRWPVWTLALSGVLVTVLFGIDSSAASVAVLAPAVGLYSVALRRGRAQQVVAAVVAVGAVVAADAVHHGRPSVGQTAAHVLLVAVPLLAAEVIRTHQANLRLIVERLELAEQARTEEAERRATEERIRIARDLHDVVAHTLTEINVQAGAAAERAGPGEPRAALERIEQTSHAAIGELRAVLGVLRGPDVGGAPLAPAPGIGEIAGLVGRACDNGLDVDLRTNGSPPSRLAEATSVAAYRIVQESLTNARRHAPGAPVTVSLSFETTGLELTVDNATAVHANGTSSPSGVGITGMRERAAAVGGYLDAGPTPSGFRVRADLPYEPSR